MEGGNKDICKLIKDLKKEILENRKQIGEINTSMVPIVNALEMIMQEITGIKDKYINLERKVVEQQEEIKYLKRQAKENNIVIHRVPEGKEGEDPSGICKKTIEICTRVGVKLEEGDINKCHRIGTQGNERPILVSFKSYNRN